MKNLQNFEKQPFTATLTLALNYNKKDMPL